MEASSDRLPTPALPPAINPPPVTKVDLAVPVLTRTIENTTAPARVPVAPPLPVVPDLRPQLAAFMAALAKQQSDVLVALRQAASLCAQQQAEIESVKRQLETLNHRSNIARMH